jgi:hypothetical protein
VSRTSRMTRSPAPLHEQLEAAAESAAEPGALHAVEGSHRHDATGTYRWSVSGDKLGVDVVGDRVCADRNSFWNGTFTRTEER